MTELPVPAEKKNCLRKEENIQDSLAMFKHSLSICVYYIFRRFQRAVKENIITLVKAFSFSRSFKSNITRQIAKLAM